MDKICEFDSMPAPLTERAKHLIKELLLEIYKDSQNENILFGINNGLIPKSLTIKEKGEYVITWPNRGLS